MQALVLAAGWATRLGTITGGGPKHLLPIGSRTVIDFVLDRLGAVPEIEHVTVITHHVFFPLFMEWAAARPGRPPVSVMSDGTTSLDTRLGAVGDMAYFIQESGIDDDLLVVAGDNLFDFDLASVARTARHDFVVGLYDCGSLKLAPLYGVVEIEDGVVTSFVEKPEHPRSTLISTVVYGIPRQRLGVVQAYLEAGGDPDKSGDLIAWLHTRERIFGQVFSGRWIDIGSPDEYARAQAEFGG
ncbi:MAG: sugar phosphate nucleotidyltransferase [Chloroflexota bacterium]|nr:sugar phosphate nucleotidyltransferase [Chloroflexota bacterium]MDE2897138.1 sugar phosphate nucleotidyltransferase [Chloroflexota bacterium]